ncbi:hypothetical protein [Sphingomonas sp.]|jgi:hypothetical protein|uniref:hypothetical protein n=1 Tax=Sphingomonas sp. TaxID=28214 RepID=UPI002ED9E5CE
MAPEYRTDTEVRAALRVLIDRRGLHRQELSRVLGKAPGYVHDFLERGAPQRLEVADAARLARYMGIDAIELGVTPGQAEV